MIESEIATAELDLKLARKTDQKAAWADKHGENIIRAYGKIYEQFIDPDDCDCDDLSEAIGDELDSIIDEIETKHGLKEVCDKLKLMSAKVRGGE